MTVITQGETLIRSLIVSATIVAAALSAAQPANASPNTSDSTQSGQSDVYYNNCAAARAAGAAPILQGQAGYRAGLDRDGDGIACE